MSKSIFVFLLFLACNSFSQEVPNHTWKIIVKDSLTADQNLVLVSQTLLANDFAIENTDPGSHKIISAIKQLENSSSTYFLEFTVLAGVIEVTGEWNANTTIYFQGVKSKSTFKPIENRGGRFGELFIKMNDFALKMSGSYFYVF